MSNPLTEAVKISTFERITHHANGHFGGDEFSFWIDVKELRLGDNWLSHLESALRDCDFLVVLVAPLFLRSKYCRAEFEFFRKLFEDVGGCILPIQLRNIPADTARIGHAERAWLKEIRTRQEGNWTSLEEMAEPDRNKIFRVTADDICPRIHALDLLHDTAGAEPPNPPPSPAVNSEAVPVTSGYYHRSGQSPNSLLSNVAFSGPICVTTDAGKVAFSITSATLTTTIRNAKIADPYTDFSGMGWNGPDATVRRLNAGPNSETPLIRAVADYLMCEVLAKKGERGGEDRTVRLWNVPPRIEQYEQDSGFAARATRLPLASEEP